MKRKTVIVFMLLFAVLSACAQNSVQVANGPASPVLDRIVQNGELVVGTAGSMPPLNMTTKDGEIIGFDMDLAGSIAGAMGVKVKFEAMPFSELLPALKAGKIDMIISSMTITPQRNMDVAFVGPYLASGKGFLTKRRAIASAKSASEINSPGTTLAALEGSTSQKLVETLIPRATLITTKNHDEAVQMVIQGRAHAMVADYPFCITAVLRYPDKGLLTLVSPVTYEPLGIAVPANDPHMINWLENLLNSLKGSGAMDDMKKRWFENRSWLGKLQ